MDITAIKNLANPDVKIVTYGRYMDDRGYFSESIRMRDIDSRFVKDFQFRQMNESYSKKGVVRGLHFQWNPYMGKLVRTIVGTMYDIALDIRLDSPFFGKALIHKLQASRDENVNTWIWVPPGFAHGNFFTEDTYIEYVCTGDYAPDTEAGISPFASDIDWSLSKKEYVKLFNKIKKDSPQISEKDKKGFSLNEWKNKDDAKNFSLSKLSGK